MHLGRDLCNGAVEMTDFEWPVARPIDLASYERLDIYKHFLTFEIPVASRTLQFDVSALHTSKLASIPVFGIGKMYQDGGRTMAPICCALRYTTPSLAGSASLRAKKW